MRQKNAPVSTGHRPVIICSLTKLSLYRVSTVQTPLSYFAESIKVTDDILWKLYKTDEKIVIGKYSGVEYFFKKKKMLFWTNLDATSITNFVSMIFGISSNDNNFKSLFGTVRLKPKRLRAINDIRYCRDVLNVISIIYDEAAIFAKTLHHGSFARF